MTPRQALQEALALLDEIFEWRPVVREREDAAKLAEWRKALETEVFDPFRTPQKKVSPY